MPRDSHDYTIEVCIDCGCQLSRNTPGGRCTNRAHWNRGGMVVRVIARPLADQDRYTQQNWHAIPISAERR